MALIGVSASIITSVLSSVMLSISSFRHFTLDFTGLESMKIGASVAKYGLSPGGSPNLKALLFEFGHFFAACEMVKFRDEDKFSSLFIESIILVCTLFTGPCYPTPNYKGG